MVQIWVLGFGFVVNDWRVMSLYLELYFMFLGWGFCGLALLVLGMERVVLGFDLWVVEYTDLLISGFWVF